MLQCLQWLRLGVSINDCYHNAPHSETQMRWIRQPVLRRNAVFNICVSQVIVAFEVCAWAPSFCNIPSRLRKTVLLQLSRCYSLHAAECRFYFLFKCVVYVIIRIDIHILWNNVKICQNSCMQLSRPRPPCTRGLNLTFWARGIGFVGDITMLTRINQVTNGCNILHTRLHYISLNASSSSIIIW